MKTAISVDDRPLQEADRNARKMGVSRSRLFSVAMERFLRQRRHEELTEQLNRVYAVPDPEERRLPASMKSKLRKTLKDRW